MDKIIMSSRSCFVRFLSVILVIAVVVSMCSCKANNNDFNGVRFGKTRTISVMVDSYADDSIVNSSLCAQYIHDAVLRDCNIDVKFVGLNNRDITHGTTADISITENYSYLTTNYKMNAVVNMATYLDEYSDSLSDLKTLMGDELYSCTSDPSEVWYLSQSSFEPEAQVTFIRADWLEKLGLEAPTTKSEFYNCIVAFRDNAGILLGEDSESMIPFFIDNEPSVSAKPLLDSFLDTGISDKEFYVNGYNRATQDGFAEGLRLLNDWYLEGLLPSDFMYIRPNTKESYEPIENGYVGAFCSESDYVYKMFGDVSNYVAVNTFENKDGEYTYWNEEYLKQEGMKIYIPATCRDPLACLVYLNWISSPGNIEAVQDLSQNNPNEKYGYDKYLITCDGMYPDGRADNESVKQARETAMAVNVINRGCKCVRYNPYFFDYIETDVDIKSLYPDSTKNFTCGVIASEAGCFDTNYPVLYEDYLCSGAYAICYMRENEWNKVVVDGNMLPW